MGCAAHLQVQHLKATPVLHVEAQDLGGSVISSEHSTPPLSPASPPQPPPSPLKGYLHSVLAHHLTAVLAVQRYADVCCIDDVSTPHTLQPPQQTQQPIPLGCACVMHGGRDHSALRSGSALQTQKADTTLHPGQSSRRGARLLCVTAMAPTICSLYVHVHMYPCIDTCTMWTRGWGDLGCGWAGVEIWIVTLSACRYDS